MAVLNWQTNDALSTFDTENRKLINGFAAETRVETGYVNLKLPASEDFEFLKDLGKELQKRFQVLSPTEALRIKLNLNAERLTAPVKLHGVDVWSVLVDRYDDAGVQQQILISGGFFNTPGYVHTDTSKARTLQRLAEREVANCDFVISGFLGSSVRELIVDAAKTPERLRNRYGKSRLGPQGVEEPFMQATINAISEVAGPVNPNVYSRSYDGTEADPVKDFIASAFCGMITKPNGEPNRSWVKQGLINMNVEDAANQGLGTFYPHLNLSEIPENYPLRKVSALKIRDTLYAARSVSTSDVRISKSFGKGGALKAAFDFGSPMVKLSIVSALYPWVHNSRNPFGQYRSRNVVKFVFSRAPGRPTMYALADQLTHTLFLMDYLNKQQVLLKHAVGYLKWIKSRCESAMARQRILPAFAKDLNKQVLNFTPGGSALPSNAFSVAQGLRRSLPLVRATSPIGTGGTVTGGPTTIPFDLFQAIKPGLSQGTESVTQQIVTDTPPPGIDGEAVIAAQREKERLEREEQASETRAADQKRNIYIYTGSAVVAAAAIAGIVYVKRKRRG